MCFCKLKVIIHAFSEVGVPDDGIEVWKSLLCTPTDALEPLSIIRTSNVTKQMHRFLLLLRLFERKPACEVFLAVCDEFVFKDVHDMRATTYLYPRETGHDSN